MSTEKKVDVLATWREAAELVKACSAIDPDYVGPSPQEMAAAGEAVAELIEAATDARDTLHSCIDALSSEEQDDHDALARLTAALARAGGAT